MKAFLLLILTGLFTGGVIIAAKLARIDGISPLSILLWQISGSSILLWSMLLLRRNRKQLERVYLSGLYIRYYLTGGLLGISLPFALIYTIVQELPVGLVGLITSLSPLLTYTIARLARQETGSFMRLSGLLIGLTGVSLIMLSKETDTQTEHWPYLLMAMGVPLSLATSNLYRSMAWPAGSQPLPLATGTLSVQGIILLPVLVIYDQFQLSIFTSGSMNLIAAALMLMAGLSYFGTFMILKVAGPVYLSQLGYVITVVTVCLGILLFDEQYRLTDWLAMGFIFTSLFMVSGNSKALSPVNKFNKTVEDKEYEIDMGT